MGIKTIEIDKGCNLRIKDPNLWTTVALNDKVTCCIRENVADDLPYWQVRSGLSTMELVCTAWSPEGKELYMKVLALKRGVVVLGDLRANCPRLRVNWRSPDFQAFLERYDLRTVKKMDPNRTYLSFPPAEFEVREVLTDGTVKPVESGFAVTHGNWAVVRQWSEGELINVLYTAKRISAWIQDSLVAHGVPSVN